MRKDFPAVSLADERWIHPRISSIGCRLNELSNVLPWSQGLWLLLFRSKRPLAIQRHSTKAAVRMRLFPLRCDGRHVVTRWASLRHSQDFQTWSLFLASVAPFICIRSSFVPYNPELPQSFDRVEQQLYVYDISVSDCWPPSERIVGPEAWNDEVEAIDETPFFPGRGSLSFSVVCMWTSMYLQ